MKNLTFPQAAFALGFFLFTPAFAASPGGIDTPSGQSQLPLQVEGVHAIDIQDANAAGGANITFQFPTNIKFPFTAGNTIINETGSISTNGGLTISNSNGGPYGLDILAPHRIASGDLTNGGTGGMWVGPDQFVGSENSTELGFYNNGSWRLNIHNDGWVTFNNEVTQIGSWTGAAGDPYNYATFGAAGNQQLVIRTDLNAFFFPWTAAGNLYVNGNINVSGNANIGGAIATSSTINAANSLTNALGACAAAGGGTLKVDGSGNLSCASGSGGGATVNSMYSSCGLWGVMWFSSSSQNNYRTGAQSCPAGTTDVQEYQFYDSAGRNCYLHTCYN